MVYDDEHIGLWERGKGSTSDNMADGTKLTVYFRKPQLREEGILPKGGIARFYGSARITDPGRYTKKCGAGWSSRKRTATPKERLCRADSGRARRGFGRSTAEAGLVALLTPDPRGQSRGGRAAAGACGSA